MAVSPAPRRARQAPAMAKIESTYGTDPTPAGGTDDIQTYNSAVSAIPEFASIRMDPHSASYTRQVGSTIFGQQICNYSSTMQMQGASAAGIITGTPWAGMVALLKACGTAVTVSAGTSNTIIPVAIGSESSATVYARHGNVWTHKVKGFRGNAVITGNPRGPAMLKVAGKGLYTAPVSNATWTSWTGGTNRAIPFFSIGCTITPTISGSGGTAWTPIVSSFEFDFGCQPQVIEDCNGTVGVYQVQILERLPRVTIDMVMDEDTDAACIDYADWFLAQLNTTTTTHAVAIAHNGAVGNRFAYSFPTANVVSVTPGESNNLGSLRVVYELCGATAQSEWSIVNT